MCVACQQVASLLVNLIRKLFNDVEPPTEVTEKMTVYCELEIIGNKTALNRERGSFKQSVKICSK